MSTIGRTANTVYANKVESGTGECFRTMIADPSCYGGGGRWQNPTPSYDGSCSLTPSDYIDITPTEPLNSFLSQYKLVKTYLCDGGPADGSPAMFLLDKKTYTCPSGYSDNGSNCKKTTYSCASGYSLSGTSCVKTTYSCPSGYSNNGSNCKKTVYSCPRGGRLSGTQCVF